jgi:hypothetical protein
MARRHETPPRPDSRAGDLAVMEMSLINAKLIQGGMGDLGQVLGSFGFDGRAAVSDCLSHYPG